MRHHDGRRQLLLSNKEPRETESSNLIFASEQHQGIGKQQTHTYMRTQGFRTYNGIKWKAWFYRNVNRFRIRRHGDRSTRWQEEFVGVCDWRLSLKLLKTNWFFNTTCLSIIKKKSFWVSYVCIFFFLWCIYSTRFIYKPPAHKQGCLKGDYAKSMKKNKFFLELDTKITFVCRETFRLHVCISSMHRWKI